jgi:CheY-like chemotaxis protein
MTRILVIDSDRLVCGALERVLAASGYAVTIATSGRAGLEAARRPFAAAIIDLCLPDMSGFDAIRALRTHAPGLRVIAMSELMTECSGDGAPDFLGMAANLRGILRLGKPFGREELLHLVGRCCA